MDQFTNVGRGVYHLLRSQIDDGTLAECAKLPSTRILAAELGVSRTTVTVAFEQLAAEGFIVTAPGKTATVARRGPSARRRNAGRPEILPASPGLSDFGRRIAKLAPLATARDLPVGIDFRYGAIASADFPGRAWRRALHSSLARQEKHLYYCPPEGDARLRNALQGYLHRTRGVVCSAEQIVIVQGCQQALDLCARILLNPRDTFVTEDPSYLMARRCFEAIGASVLPVAVDHEGMVTAELPTKRRVRLVYVTPSHQFPLGGVLPVARRAELLHWARQRDCWVIEDDYDGEFRYGQRPIDALQSMDDGTRVVYVGTFSKTLSPQFRLGYMVVPVSLVSTLREAKRLADRHAPALEQDALASLIESGAYDRHVRKARRENERRRAALLAATTQHLGDCARIDGTAAGLHVVLWLPSVSQLEETEIAKHACAKGVGIYPVSPLYQSSDAAPDGRPAGFVLGYGSLTPTEIDRGIRTLAGVIRQR